MVLLEDDPEEEPEDEPGVVLLDAPGVAPVEALDRLDDPLVVDYADRVMEMSDGRLLEGAPTLMLGTRAE